MGVRRNPAVWTASIARRFVALHVVVVVGVLAMPALLGSCGGGAGGDDDDVTGPGGAIASIVVLEPAFTLKGIGVTKPVTVTALGRRGETISNPSLSWESSSPSVATVTPGSGGSAVITSVAKGSAIISAKAGAVRGDMAVTVDAGVQHPSIDKTTIELFEGEIDSLETRVDADPGVKDSLCWTSSNEQVARVTSTCTQGSARVHVQALTRGQATLRAEAVADKLKSATVLVYVLMRRVDRVNVTLDAAVIDPGQTTRARARIYDHESRELAFSGRSVLWSSTNTSIATIDSTGLITGVAEGSTVIVATIDGVPAQLPLSVQRSRVETVALLLGRNRLYEGESTTANATARGSAGGILTGRAFQWSSSNPAVATIDPAGTVTAIAAGTTTIAVIVEGVQDSESLTVSKVPVAAVRVELDSAVLNLSQTTTARAFARDSAGNPLTGRVATWISLNPAVATVNQSTGDVAGVAVGKAAIRATVEGMAGEDTVTVQLEKVVSVTIGAPTKISVGKKGKATATPRNAAGSPLQLAGRTLTWTSSAPSVATITSTGDITAVSAGTTNLVATVDGVLSAPKQLDVDNDVVASVDVSGNPAVMRIASSATLSYTPKGANGLPLTGRQATWSSSDTAIATISATGVITAVTSGLVDFTATVDGVAGKSAKSAVTITGPVVQLSAFSNHACTRTASRQVYCWGKNDKGQLGLGAFGTYEAVPKLVPNWQFDEISVGHNLTCGRDGTVWYCWGDNLYGALGDGTTTNRPSPTRVTGSATFSTMSSGNYHTCGLATNGTAYCWGWNTYGQLGDGTNVNKSVPTPVPGRTFTQLRVLAFSTCGIESSGQTYCWGYNTDGEIGDSTTVHRNVPTPVNTSNSGPLTALWPGWQHLCATVSGAAYCWAHNFYGESGNGTNTRSLIPVPGAIGAGPFSHISGGYMHTCGVATNLRVYCWGYNSRGQLGNGTTTDANTPVQIGTGLDIRQVRAGWQRSCGMTSAGLVYCWGANHLGQVGDGSVIDRLVPTLVK